jgi:hypothetical protein
LYKCKFPITGNVAGPGICLSDCVDCVDFSLADRAKKYPEVLIFMLKQFCGPFSPVYNRVQLFIFTKTTEFTFQILRPYAHPLASLLYELIT